MAWPGGKDGSGVAQRLINEIPPHDVFISPFLGDCAILRRKRPAIASIGVDLDRANLERWAKAQPVPGLRLYHCCGIEWLRHAFDWYALRAPAAASRDADVRAARSGAARAKAVQDPAAGCGGGTRWTAADVAEYCDAGSRGGRSTFVYVDPPYLLSSRRSQRPLYANELSDADHAELLATLARLPALVMVSHYPHPLYAEALAAWRTFTYRATTRGGGLATEQVWCNYAAPDVLHDARYLGRNKREREKIRRRVRNWTQGLARMPALERQAVLDSLTSADADGSRGVGSRGR